MDVFGIDTHVKEVERYLLAELSIGDPNLSETKNEICQLEKN
jgi:hypothetical protein